MLNFNIKSHQIPQSWLHIEALELAIDRQFGLLFSKMIDFEANQTDSLIVSDYSIDCHTKMLISYTKEQINDQQFA